MRLKKGNQGFLLLFLMGICMLTGCNLGSSVDEKADNEVQIDAVCEEKTEILTEEQMKEESEYFTAPEDIAELGLPEDMLAYWMVLNNKKAFVSMNEGMEQHFEDDDNQYHRIYEGGQKFFLNEYFWFLDSVESEYYVYNFMIVDMDGDGLEEIVLECYPGTTQILHYEEGEVYSYRFDGNSMLNIHINGIYHTTGGATSSCCNRLTELNKDGYIEETFAQMYNNYFEIEGKEVTSEEFFDYMDSINSIDLVERIEFTESMIDRRFLGDLSEQEITLVKGIPTENMIENETDYQENKQTLQLYAAVLTGEEDVVYVEEDTFWENRGVELSWKYFSVVDMDRDGIQELVFICNHDVIRVLRYEEGKIYGYELRTYSMGTPIITMDGVFQTDDLSPTGYARIVSFDENGYKVEPVEDYESGNHERIRYCFFSEEAINQWLK